MSGHVIITSTTDNQEAVEQAATAFEGDQLVTPASQEDTSPEGEGSVATINRTRNVASTTDTPEQIAEVQADLDEQREDRKQEYLDGPHMGKTRAKLLRRLSRMADQNETLRERLAAYESGQQPAATQQNSDGQDQEHLHHQDAVRPHCQGG